MDILPHIGLAQDSIYAFLFVIVLGCVCSVCLGIYIGNCKTRLKKMGSGVFSFAIFLLIEGFSIMLGFDKYSLIFSAVFYIGLCVLSIKGFCKEDSLISGFVNTR